MDWRPADATCPTYSIENNLLQLATFYTIECGVIQFICTRCANNAIVVMASKLPYSALLLFRYALSVVLGLLCHFR